MVPVLVTVLRLDVRFGSVESDVCTPCPTTFTVTPKGSKSRLGPTPLGVSLSCTTGLGSFGRRGEEGGQWRGAPRWKQVRGQGDGKVRNGPWVTE